jgi:hypothetical protein
MRQSDDNPIINYCTEIRKNINYADPIKKFETKINKNENGVYLYRKAKRVRELLEEYFCLNDFKIFENNIKVIAWRNKTISQLNNLIRKMIFGENTKEFEKNEILISNKPIYSEFTSRDHNYWLMTYNNSEELKVLTSKIEYKTFKNSHLSFHCKIWNLGVMNINYSSKPMEKIIIICNEEQDKYKEVLKRLRAIALNSKESKDWAIYFDALKWSADVSYGYAITAHKAQGSTYKNVLIFEDDINSNPNIIERNKIKYTSYARASDKLFIFKE